MASKPIKKTKSTTVKPAVTSNNEMSNKKIMAIIGLVVNILVLPGLGTIVGGRTKTGVIQLVLFLVGIPLMLILIGFFLMLGVWIWGIITGVQMIKEADAA